MDVFEESPMRAIFGPHPQVKVIETLVLHPAFEYNLTELAESAEISKATIFELRDTLLHYGIMKPTKKVGRIQLYQFDKSSPVGKLLNALSYKLADIDVDLLLKREERKEAAKTGEVVTA